jgi:hypothetical protein
MLSLQRLASWMTKGVINAHTSSQTFPYAMLTASRYWMPMVNPNMSAKLAPFAISFRVGTSKVIQQVLSFL